MISPRIQWTYYKNESAAVMPMYAKKIIGYTLCQISGGKKGHLHAAVNVLMHSMVAGSPTFACSCKEGLVTIVEWRPKICQTLGWSSQLAQHRDGDSTHLFPECEDSG